MPKRLYVVTVTIEYAALAESPEDACEHVMDAIHDTSFIEECADAREAKNQQYCLPDGWEAGYLVYGADEDTTWKEAVEAEKVDDAEAARVAELKAKQVTLPVE